MQEKFPELKGWWWTDCLETQQRVSITSTDNRGDMAKTKDFCTGKKDQRLTRKRFHDVDKQE